MGIKMQYNTLKRLSENVKIGMVVFILSSVVALYVTPAESAKNVVLPWTAFAVAMLITSFVLDIMVSKKHRKMIKEHQELVKSYLEEAEKVMNEEKELNVKD